MSGILCHNYGFLAFFFFLFLFFLAHTDVLEYSQTGEIGPANPESSMLNVVPVHCSVPRSRTYMQSSVSAADPEQSRRTAEGDGPWKKVKAALTRSRAVLTAVLMDNHGQIVCSVQSISNDTAHT